MEEAPKSQNQAQSFYLEEDNESNEMLEDQDSFVTAYFGQGKSMSFEEKTFEENQTFGFPNSIAEQKSMSAHEDLTQQQLKSLLRSDATKKDKARTSNYQEIFEQKEENQDQSPVFLNINCQIQRKKPTQQMEIVIDNEQNQQSKNTIEIQNDPSLQDAINTCFSRLSVSMQHAEEDQQTQKKEIHENQNIIAQNQLTFQNVSLNEDETRDTEKKSFSLCEMFENHIKLFKTIPVLHLSSQSNEKIRPQRHRSGRLQYWKGQKIVYKNREAQYEIRRKNLMDLLFLNDLNKESIIRHQIYNWRQKSIEGQIQISKKSTVYTDLTDPKFQWLSIKCKKYQLIVNESDILIKYASFDPKSTSNIRLNLSSPHQIHNTLKQNVKLIITAFAEHRCD